MVVLTGVGMLKPARMLLKNGDSLKPPQTCWNRISERMARILYFSSFSGEWQALGKRCIRCNLQSQQRDGNTSRFLMIELMRKPLDPILHCTAKLVMFSSQFLEHREVSGGRIPAELTKGRRNREVSRWD